MATVAGTFMDSNNTDLEVAQKIREVTLDNESIAFYPSLNILEFLILSGADISEILSRVQPQNKSRSQPFLILRLNLLKNHTPDLKLQFDA